MTCAEMRRWVPGYLDGALPESFDGDARARVSRHLEGCEECREELQRYRRLSSVLSNMQAATPPEELAVGIRIALAQARAAQGWGARTRRYKNRLQLVLENILEPLAVPATGGLVAALLVFVIVYQILGGIPLTVESADLPTSLLQPARLETLAGFQMSGLQDTTPAEEHALMVEATVNATGEAVSYRVISGQMNGTVRRELDQVLLFSRFRPQLSFGRPKSGGRVVLSFNKISVRG